MTKFVITETLWSSEIFKTIMASLHRGRFVVVHLYSTFTVDPQNLPTGVNLYQKLPFFCNFEGCKHPQTFLLRSVVLPLWAIENLWENAYNLVDCPPKVTRLKTSNLPKDAYNRWEFWKKLCRQVASERQIYGQNSKFWLFWRLYSHISEPINVKFGMKKWQSAPPHQISHLSGQCFWITD